jgi:hypothetical protein
MQRITTMPTYYQIRVQGHLDQSWSAWFDNLTIQHDLDGGTTLAGPVADQAALYGLIEKARDLGLTLLVVLQLDTSASPDSDAATG